MLDLAKIPHIPAFYPTAAQAKAGQQGNYLKGRSSAIKYIVIHYTANNGDTAKGNCNYFSRELNPHTSAHYFVDENGVMMSVDPKDTAYHAGGGLQGAANAKYGTKSYRSVVSNSNSIGIEHCSRSKGGSYYFLPETIANSVELVRALMEKYKIPIGNVVRHYDVSFKQCPAPFLQLAEWEKYKEKLKGAEDMTEQETRKIAKEEAVAAVKAAVKAPPKPDNTPSPYAIGAIDRAKKKGILTGGGGGDLQLHSTMTREAFFVALDKLGLLYFRLDCPLSIINCQLK